MKGCGARTISKSELQREGRNSLCANIPLVTRWLAAQDMRNAPASSNQPALQLPFQRWFKFKEAFSPQFIVDCAANLSNPASTCLDPFGGSGTTALTAQFLGIRPTTIEVNPFLADLIEAKLSAYDTERLQADYFEVLQLSKNFRRSPDDLLNDAPPTLVQPGKDGRWIYPKDVAKRIFALREAIAQVESSQNKVLLNVVLGSTLIAVSNVIVNGKGRKYRHGWETRQKTAADVELAFRGSFFEVFSDICHYASRALRDFILIRGDSRTVIDLSDKVDFAVLSPPYPNSFDYTDIYNLELWMLGYIKSKPDNVRLRTETLRSHVQIYREFSDDTLDSKVLARTYRQLCRVRDDLWNPHIPEMICAYFADMRTILTKLRTKLNKGGKAFLAIGNSKYAGIKIDTKAILQEIALANGYSRATSSPIRSMRSSAQQGGRHELAETLITLS
jgi:hypothetical protein